MIDGENYNSGESLSCNNLNLIAFGYMIYMGICLFKTD